MISKRAQTGIDFLIGMSVFMLTVAFIFSFVPNMFEPFTTDGGANMIVADRSAAVLAEGLLGDPTRPAVLNATCTAGFFNTTVADPVGCQYENNVSNIHTALGVSDRTNLNVTIETDSGIRTVNETTLATGPTPPDDSGSTVVSRRVVSIEAVESQLFVRVW